jgi:hypothetical protein
MRQPARRDPEPVLAPTPRPAVRSHGVDRSHALAGAHETLTRDGATGVSTWGSMLALQGAAGNRAVAGLVAHPVVQRHPGPTENAEVQGASAEAAASETAPGESAPEGSETSTTDGAGAETTEGASTEGGEATTQEGATPDQEIANGGSGSQSASGEAASTTAGGAQPGTGTTGTTGTTGSFLTGAARRTSIENTCRASATGMWAMRIIEHWSIPVDYEYSGEGSFHRGGNIYINRNLGVGAAALTLMHEAQHAETYKSGRQADRTTLPRDEYIRLSIADEAEAVVRQIEGLAITERLWDVSGAGVNDNLKQRYLTAFYATRDQLHADNPDMSTEEINRRCRIATRDGEVTRWFHDGTFTTSTNHNSYAIFYGNQWDEVHRTPGRS